MSIEIEEKLGAIAAAILAKNVIDTDLGTMVTEMPGGSIWWTGWKEWSNSVDMTAQIFWWPPKKVVLTSKESSADKPVVYYGINLPGFDIIRTVGHMPIKFSIEQPAMMVTPKTTRGEMRAIFAEGLKRLVEYVVRESPWWLEEAIKLGDHQWDRRSE